MSNPYTSYYRESVRKKYIWYGLFYFEFTDEVKAHLKIHWKNLFIFISTVAISFWLLASGALYFWYKYERKFVDVEYSKIIILPIRRVAHRRELGKYWIKKGDELYQENKKIEAFSYYKSGLNIYPRALEARLKLSDFYFNYVNRPIWGIKVCMDGLRYNPKIDYIMKTLNYMLKFEFYDEIIEVCNNFLKIEKRVLHQKILLMYKAKANYYLGNLFLSEKIMNKNDLYDYPEAALTKSKIEEKRGNHGKAIQILEKAIEKHTRYQPLYILIIQILRNTKNHEKAHLYSILLQSMNPLSHEPRINNLYYYLNSNKETLLLKGIENYLDDFRYDTNALLSLAHFAEKTNRVEIAKKLYEEEFPKKFHNVAFFFAYTFTLISNQKGHETLSLIQDTKSFHSNWNSVQKNMLAGIKSLAYIITKQPILVKYHNQIMLNSTNLSVLVLLKMGHFYNFLGDLNMASKTFKEAYRRYPQVPETLKNLLNYQIEKKEKIDDINKNIIDLVTKNYLPDKCLLRNAIDYISNDKFLYSEGNQKAIDSINESLFKLNKFYIQN